MLQGFFIYIFEDLHLSVMTSLSGNTSNRVYIASDEFGWLPAKVVSNSGTHAIVQVKDYEEDLQIPACEVAHGPGFSSTSPKHKRYENIPVKDIKVDLSLSSSDGVLPLQNVDQDGKLIVVEDMVDLGFLHEAAILYNLKARHSKGIPYTRTGDIIIAVNPYQWIHELYTDEMRSFYAEKLVWDSGE
jgi:myosin-5